MQIVSVIIFSFLVGGGVITPQMDMFDLGGFVSFSMYETNVKEKTPLSSLYLSARFGYAPWEEFFPYVIVGIKNLTPLSPLPTLNQFGVGAKISLLSKERDINFNFDGHIEYWPFIEGTDKNFPNRLFWQISPTMSFKFANSFIYIGGGYKDFVIRLDDGVVLKSRAENRFFVVVGGDYYLNPKTYISVELHSFGQNLISAGISHRF
jgi:hypothetical protein